MIKKSEPLPARFRRLWASDALSSTGDGFTLVAAPLLLVTLTTSPVLIAGGVFAAQIPWLLFGLHAGAIADRPDHRKPIIGSARPTRCCRSAGRRWVLCSAAYSCNSPA